MLRQFGYQEQMNNKKLAKRAYQYGVDWRWG